MLVTNAQSYIMILFLDKIRRISQMQGSVLGPFANKVDKNNIWKLMIFTVIGG